MKKGVLILILVGIAVLTATAFFIFSRNFQLGSEIVYFYGDTCPACAKVEKFFEENQIEGKVSFVKKEVFNNEENARELARVAQKCGLAAAAIGVPFLWDGSECYVGEPDVVNFFKEKAGIGQ